MEGNHFAFTWKISCFNELVARHPNGSFFYSERFWSPRGQSVKSSDISVINEQNNSYNNTGYLWRLKLFPNGVDKISNDFISLYLESIQTHYEKQNNITGRHTKFQLSLYRDLNIPTTKQSPILVIDRHTLETKFEFNGVKADYGFARIVPLREIFPNDAEVDLIVRAQIFEDAITSGEGSSSMDINNVSLMSFERYFGVDRFCDVEFVFDCGSSMKAHRVILTARSTYFEKMLEGEWLEGHMKTISIKDMPFDAFRCIVHHLYTGKLEEGLTFELLREIYSKADMLSLEQLGRMAAKRIIKLMNHENWDQILMLGWKYYDDRLKDAGQDFAVKHWNDIKDTDNMKQVFASGHVDRIVELVLQSFFTPNNRIESSDLDYIHMRDQQLEKHVKIIRENRYEAQFSEQTQSQLFEPILSEKSIQYLAKHISVNVNNQCVIMKADQVDAIPDVIRDLLVNILSSEKDVFKSVMMTPLSPDHQFRKFLYDQRKHIRPQYWGKEIHRR
ncbi:14366_t:CDS:2 [Funneliformis caledonium]|uniref:14366_t:CDS:1 n=1 Tax=Funneliformis caledonium TaxID=1117310 RepID=A0A9N8ZK50_9GLOM|nr:14366_t:CDS:2 [Funneliformis caledonium]